jgi:hypothetical protein
MGLSDARPGSYDMIGVLLHSRPGSRVGVTPGEKTGAFSTDAHLRFRFA